MGPLVGGVLLEYFWWGAVFLIAVPIIVLLLILGPMLLPEFRDPKAGRLDFYSAALSLAAILAVIWDLKRIAENGIAWLPVLTIARGGVIGVPFVRRQRKLTDPLIDLRLFRTPAFSACLAINILCLFIAFGSFLFIAQYRQLVLGMGPLEAGLWTVPSGLAFFIGSLLARRIVRVVRPAYVIAGGFALAAFGFGMLTQIDGNGLWVLVVGYVVFSFGLAPVAIVTTDLIVGVAPPERAGAASAISETSFEFGGAHGIAVLGSVVTAVYRNVMADGVSQGIAADA